MNDLTPRTKFPSQGTQRSIAAWVLFLVVGVILPLYAYKVGNKQDYTDFDVYYRTAVRTQAQNWIQIYDLRDGASPFRYPPIFLPFFRPFAELTQTQAQVTWFFIQYLFFGLGFYWIYRTLLLFRGSVRRMRQTKTHALWLTSLTLLLVLRFCLDTFTIGQVSSLMFFGFCYSLYAWTLGKTGPSVLALLIPTLFKIGPGFLYGAYLTERKRKLQIGIKSGILGLTAIYLAAWAMMVWIFKSPPGLWKSLWQSWSVIVAQDSAYYDSSHYGSQSINSFLLRLVKTGWIKMSTANSLYLAAAITICGTILLFWTLRKPKSFYGRSLFFSMGFFAYFWVMPETFKYSLTPMAIPIALLLAQERKTLLTRFALLFGVFSLSLAGKDIIQDSLFFGLQNYSIPLLATFFFAGAIVQGAWDHSNPTIPNLFRSRKLGPWESLPERSRPFEASLIIAIPLVKQSLMDGELTKKELVGLHEFFHSRLGSRFEMILILWGDRISDANPLVQSILRFQKELNVEQREAVRILVQPEAEGRGAALRAGFLASRGKKILLHQLEQPCDPRFFGSALDLLANGYELVRANRRLPQTRFKIPVRLLHLVYSRHRLGLWFNFFVRKFLRIQTTDTHSGSVGLSLPLATNLFAVQTSPDFLFDIELSLTSIANGCKEMDLPVLLTFEQEKSILRIGLESLYILKGLPGLIWRYRKGCYHSITFAPDGITADDWGLSPGINQGILELARLGIVRRVSLMANTEYLHEGLQELTSLPHVELGIHFNLTYGRPLQANIDPAEGLVQQFGPSQGCFLPTPFRFLIQWLNPLSSPKKNREFVRTELKTQLDALNQKGIQIQYLDGHHHIHVIPGFLRSSSLLDSISDIIQKAGIQRVRLPYDHLMWCSAKFPLAIMARIASSRLRKNGFESLPCIYPSFSYFKDQGLLRARLALHPRSEVIVHPALRNDLAQLKYPESYSEGRVTEFRALRMLAAISLATQDRIHATLGLPQ